MKENKDNKKKSDLELDHESLLNQEPGVEDSESPEYEPVQENIDFEKSSVVRDSRYNVVFIGVLLAVIGVVAYYFIFGGSSTKKQNAIDEIPLTSKTPIRAGEIPVPAVNTSSSIASDSAISADAFKKIEPPKPVSPIAKEGPAPSTPPVGPEKSGPPIQPQILTTNSVQVNQIKQNKIKSSIMLTGGTGASGQPASSSDKNARPLNKESGDDYNLQTSSAAHVNVTKTGNMRLLIVQGKIIEAVLETPLNTNYPGPIRAVISRDVFSEKGDNVLIPRGSRVIGNIEGNFKAGQNRVLIKWNRVILPDGYDISMDSPGSDRLGNMGVDGQLHREFFTNIGNALLISAINISFAKALQEGFGIGSSQQTTTVTPQGDQTQTSTLSPTQQAAKQELERLGKTTEQWMKENFMTKPYITLDQGTVLKIFVNQDIIFPEKIAGGMQVLQ